MEVAGAERPPATHGELLMAILSEFWRNDGEDELTSAYYLASRRMASGGSAVPPPASSLSASTSPHLNKPQPMGGLYSSSPRGQPGSSPALRSASPSLHQQQFLQHSQRAYKPPTSDLVVSMKNLVMHLLRCSRAFPPILDPQQQQQQASHTLNPMTPHTATSQRSPFVARPSQTHSSFRDLKNLSIIPFCWGE